MTPHFRIYGSVALVAIIGIACAGAWNGERKRRETIWRRNRMVSLALLLNSLWDQLPIEGEAQTDDAGEFLCSWRFNALICQRNFPARPRFDRHWSAAENAYFAQMAPEEFCDSENPVTGICAITGDGMPLGKGGRVRAGEIDGDTILLIEAQDSRTHWMEPGDLSEDEIRDAADLGALCGSARGMRGAVFVGFADGRAWLLDAAVPRDALLRMATVDGAWTHDREKELGMYRVVLEPSFLEMFTRALGGK